MRRQVVLFVALTLALSFALEFWMIAHGGLGAGGGFAVLALMWVPALVSVLVRLVGREGFGDVGWRVGAGEPWLLGYLGPPLCAGLTYVLAWALGEVSFVAPAEPWFGSPGLHWAAKAGLNGTFGVLVASIFSLGEELGWRGYLVPRLARWSLAWSLWASGFIWGLWHLPLVVWGDYATSELPWVSAALFTLTTVLAGVFFAWLRLRGGSVWPAVLAHSTHNIFYQGVFGSYFDGRREWLFAGENGLFSILAYGALVLWLWRTGRWRALATSSASAVAAPTKAA